MFELTQERSLSLVTFAITEPIKSQTFGPTCLITQRSITLVFTVALEGKRSVPYNNIHASMAKSSREKEIGRSRASHRQGLVYHHRFQETAVNSESGRQEKTAESFQLRRGSAAPAPTRMSSRRACKMEEDKGSSAPSDALPGAMRSLAPLNLQLYSVSGPRSVFACFLCGKTFGLKHNLYRHLRTHTGERPHQCPHCEYRGTRRSHVLMHINRVHQRHDYHASSSSTHQHPVVESTGGGPGGGGGGVAEPVGGGVPQPTSSPV